MVQGTVPVTECVCCISNIRIVYNMPKKSKQSKFRVVAKQFLSELHEDIGNLVSFQRKATASEKTLTNANAMDEFISISSSIVDDSQRTACYGIN